jgi:hypothetical protein
MSIRTRLLRSFAGLLAIAVTLATAFAILMPMAHRWGATEAELASSLPGDELLDQPVVSWTNAITIHAPPEEVWPWIIQIGDTRGGFYSYTFIENAIAGKPLYHNAGRIVPEFQNPEVGEQIIGGMLKIREYQPGQYMLADAVGSDLGWTWVWNVTPVGNGQTRLVIRNHVQPFGEGASPLMTFFLDAGGFMMEQKMMQGIRLRAEGSTEPPSTETVELLLWFTALVTGVGAGLVFLLKAAWQKPLIVGILSVLALPLFMIAQPPVWLRAAIDLLLLAGLVWSILPDRRIADQVRSEEILQGS